MIQPISTQSLADEAFNRIVEAICGGHFDVGERLSEAALARELGISRGPLREALGRLEGKLVVRTPRIGVRVIEFSQSMIEQLFFVREALEGMAARLAAERITPAELDELAKLLDEHAAQPELASGASYPARSKDDDFHYAIVAAARCTQIEHLLLDQVYYQLRIHRRRSGKRPGRARAALEEHREILAALQSGNPDLAERVMRNHIRNARHSVVSAMSVAAADREEAPGRRRRRSAA